MNAFKEFLRLLNRIFQSVLFDPRDFLRKLKGMPYFVRDAIAYTRADRPRSFSITAADLFPVLSERFSEAGFARGHYFFQDIWAARKLKERGVADHVDVGSRLDGFVAHALTFAAVTYVDIRPLGIEVKGLNFKQGSVLSLPFQDNSLPTLSSLHVLEHIGLGRYGDPVAPQGHVAAAKELARVLAPGGRLLLGVPVGRERLCFNAHRIFSPETVLALFPGLRLIEFSLVDDAGLGIAHNTDFKTANACSYGCGLFEFEK